LGFFFFFLKANTFIVGVKRFEFLKPRFLRVSEALKSRRE